LKDDQHEFTKKLRGHVQSRLFPKVKGHNLPIDDMVARVEIRNIDPWVFTGGLGQSLIEPLFKGVGHVVNKFFPDLLQLLDCRVSGG